MSRLSKEYPDLCNSSTQDQSPADEPDISHPDSLDADRGKQVSELPDQYKPVIAVSPYPRNSFMAYVDQRWPELVAENSTSTSLVNTGELVGGGIEQQQAATKSVSVLHSSKNWNDISDMLATPLRPKGVRRHTKGAHGLKPFEDKAIDNTADVITEAIESGLIQEFPTDIEDRTAKNTETKEDQPQAQTMSSASSTDGEFFEAREHGSDTEAVEAPPVTQRPATPKKFPVRRTIAMKPFPQLKLKDSPRSYNAFQVLERMESVGMEEPGFGEGLEHDVDEDRSQPEDFQGLRSNPDESDVELVDAPSDMGETEQKLFEDLAVSVALSEELIVFRGRGSTSLDHLNPKDGESDPDDDLYRLPTPVPKQAYKDAYTGPLIVSSDMYKPNEVADADGNGSYMVEDGPQHEEWDSDDSLHRPPTPAPAYTEVEPFADVSGLSVDPAPTNSYDDFDPDEELKEYNYQQAKIAAGESPILPPDMLANLRAKVAADDARRREKEDAKEKTEAAEKDWGSSTMEDLYNEAKVETAEAIAEAMRESSIPSDGLSDQGLDDDDEGEILDLNEYEMMANFVPDGKDAAADMDEWDTLSDILKDQTSNNLPTHSGHCVNSGCGKKLVPASQEDKERLRAHYVKGACNDYVPSARNGNKGWVETAYDQARKAGKKALPFKQSFKVKQEKEETESSSEEVIPLERNIEAKQNEKKTKPPSGQILPFKWGFKGKKEQVKTESPSEQILMKDGRPLSLYRIHAESFSPLK